MRAKFSMSISVLFLFGILFAGGGTYAQTQQYVYPVELYRFAVPGSNLGYLLTPFYSEGVNSGFIYEGPVGFIYVPSLSGPNTGQPVNPGLLAIHKWRVVEDGRLYFFYAPGYTAQGPNYTHQGIIGYMYHPNQNFVDVPPPFGGTFPLYKVKSCYSQSYGYYHGKLWPYNPPIYTFELPPTGTFDCSALHGIIGGGIFTIRGTRPGGGIQVPESSPGAPAKGDNPDTPGEWFTLPPPPPPPPTCDPEEENFCWMNGGTWNSTTCSCQYILIRSTGQHPNPILFRLLPF